MSDPEHFTPAFIESFVLRCRDAGLTKEATHGLLTITATQAVRSNPGFREGFDARVAEVSDLEKQAWAMAGKVLTGGVVTAATALGGNMLYNKYFKTPGAIPTAPMAPSGLPYDAERSRKAERQAVAGRSKLLEDLNQRYSDHSKRKAELQAVVDAAGPGSASAISELQELRKSPVAELRNNYSGQLDRFATDNSRHLYATQEKLRSLNDSRGSLWNRARAFIGFPKNFDGKERQLTQRSGQLAEKARVTETLQRRLAGNYTGGDIPTAELNQNLQQRFFPTK